MNRAVKTIALAGLMWSCIFAIVSTCLAASYSEGWELYAVASALQIQSADVSLDIIAKAWEKNDEAHH